MLRNKSLRESDAFAATHDGWQPTRLTRRDTVLAMAVALASAIVYVPALYCGFVNYDDNRYVFANPHVLGGLTTDGLIWAVTTTEQANWHPLTWVSLQLDATLGGSNPMVYHGTNILFHAANAALVYLILRAMTGAVWRSLAVAALWAVHPLHVESVAWVTERKDVLSGFFGLLAIALYVRFVSSPSSLRYWSVVLCLALGLMAKAMIVTLPAGLLLLDYWPLRRLRTLADFPALAWEKVPLLLLVALSCYVTYSAQMLGGGVRSLENLPLEGRISGVTVAYSAYVKMTILPFDLAVFYPRPIAPRPWWHLAASGGFILLVTAFAIRFRRTAPYWIVGWLWFLGTLVPMIGFVQVGEQAYADRYTYWPHLGLLTAIVWGTSAIARRWKIPAAVMVIVATTTIGACAVLTRQQIAHWHDTHALWLHTTRVTTDNPHAWAMLGWEYMMRGEWNEAIRCTEEAIRINPENLESHIVRVRCFEKLAEKKGTN